MDIWPFLFIVAEVTLCLILLRRVLGFLPSSSAEQDVLPRRRTSYRG